MPEVPVYLIELCRIISRAPREIHSGIEWPLYRMSEKLQLSSYMRGYPGLDRIFLLTSLFLTFSAYRLSLSSTPSLRKAGMSIVTISINTWEKRIFGGISNVISINPYEGTVGSPNPKELFVFNLWNFFPAEVSEYKIELFHSRKRFMVPISTQNRTQTLLFLHLQHKFSNNRQSRNMSRAYRYWKPLGLVWRVILMPRRCSLLPRNAGYAMPKCCA